VAVAALFDLARAINRSRGEGASLNSIESAQAMLVGLAGVLGLDLTEPAPSSAGDAKLFIDLLVKVRDDLRAAKQWAIADQIRDQLAAEGISIADGPAGSTWRKA
jgi:cysteinyl-tRNA synthetase